MTGKSITGVVIAAGPGSRMGRFTETRPKCLLPVAGKTLLEWSVQNLRAVGCNRVVVIVGHKAEMVRLRGVSYVTNRDFTNNNILHSFMAARAFLTGQVIATYSDIWVEPSIYRGLSETPGEVVVAVDRDWLPYYEGRTDHPIAEAENAFHDDHGLLHAIGKHLEPADAGPLSCGEFIGLWRMSEAGAKRFTSVFAELDARLGPQDRFQHAASWRRAYITDFLQELIDRGDEVRCSLFDRGWAELDTPQDYARLEAIAGPQGLTTLLNSEPVP